MPTERNIHIRKSFKGDAHHQKSIGQWGEQLAADYLVQKGYAILDRNARTRYGEIDLVVSQTIQPAGLICPPQPVVVFVEVKTRTSTTYGLPEASVTPKKQAHLLAAIQAYMQEHHGLPVDWRVDVIAILGKPESDPIEIIHFENALY